MRPRDTPPGESAEHKRAIKTNLRAVYETLRTGRRDAGTGIVKHGEPGAVTRPRRNVAVHSHVLCTRPPSTQNIPGRPPSRSVPPGRSVTVLYRAARPGTAFRGISKRGPVDGGQYAISTKSIRIPIVNTAGQSSIPDTVNMRFLDLGIKS